MSAAKKEFIPDVTKSAMAAKAIREALISHGDEELILDSVEGQTNLLEDIDKLVAHMLETHGLVAGIDKVVSDLEVRRERFTTRAATLRTIIEQALVIAEIDSKLERPVGTVFLSKRAPKLDVHTEADIPADYWKAGDPILDKKALIAALKDGVAVPGAELIAVAPSLTVRIA